MKEYDKQNARFFMYEIIIPAMCVVAGALLLFCLWIVGKCKGWI